MKLHTYIIAALSAAVTAGLVIATAAYADGNYKKCAVGDRVQGRDGRIGTVKALGFGGDATTCMVQWDGDKPDPKMTLFWMLRPAGQPVIDPATTAKIVPGRYACYGGVPATYMNNGILIQSATTYSDFHGHQGAYTYDVAHHTLRFSSGTYAGSYGAYRHAGEISLSLQPITPNTYFTTVCDLHR